MTKEELKEWFAGVPAPETPLYLDPATKVNDYEFFLSSHFEGLDAAKNEYTAMPIRARLLKMKLLIESNL